MELHKTLHLVEPGIAVLPDLLKGLFRAGHDLEAIHSDEHALIFLLRVAGDPEAFLFRSRPDFSKITTVSGRGSGRVDTGTSPASLNSLGIGRTSGSAAIRACSSSSLTNSGLRPSPRAAASLCMAAKAIMGFPCVFGSGTELHA